MATWLQQMGQLVAYNANKTAALQRAMVAQANGLPVEQHAQAFPASNTTTNVTTTNHNAGGWLKGAVLGATLLAGGAGGAAGVLSGMKPEQPAIKQPEAKVVTVPGKSPEYDVITEEWDEASKSWKQVKRERAPVEKE